MAEELLRLLLDEVKSFKQEFHEFKQDMGEFKQDMLGFKQEMGEFKSSVNARFDRVESKLDSVYEQTGQLMEGQSEIKARLDVLIEDNKSIHEILGEHEVAIRTLRRRPV